MERCIQDADIVITGEGRVDFQTAFGKTPAGVAKAAKKHNVPVIAIGGALTDDARKVFEYGIDSMASAAVKTMSLTEAMREARTHLANAAERVIRTVLIGMKIAAKNK